MQRVRAGRGATSRRPTTAGEERCPAKQHREPSGAAPASRSGSLHAIDATARSVAASHSVGTMPPKKKKPPRRAPARNPRRARRTRAPRKAASRRAPRRAKAAKGKKGKGKENKPESDSEEEEPPPPTERELWLADGGILPQMTCGAEDLLRYELLKHDEAGTFSTI